MERMVMKKKYFSGLSRILMILLSVMLITACDKIFDFDEEGNSDDYTESSDYRDKDDKSDGKKDDAEKEAGKDNGGKDDNESGNKKDDPEGKTDADSGKTDSEVTEGNQNITEAPTVTPEATDLDVAKNALIKKLDEKYAEFKEWKANIWIGLSNNVYNRKFSEGGVQNIGDYYIYVPEIRYNWNLFDQEIQFGYAFIDLDNDGFDELITCKRDYIGSESSGSELIIYKYLNNEIIEMLNEPNCSGFGFSSYSNSWYYPFEFSSDYSYLHYYLPDEEDSSVFLKLNGTKYELFAYYVGGDGVVTYYEDGAEKKGNFTKYEEYEKSYFNNCPHIDLNIYEYMENPLSRNEQERMFQPISDKILEDAKKDGHISESPRNYVVDDIDDDGIYEVIINDNSELLIYDFYGSYSYDILNYKYKDIYEYAHNDYTYEADVSMEYYYEEKIVHCHALVSYMGVMGTTERAFEYYCYFDKYSNLTEWEIDNYDNIHFTGDAYEYAGDEIIIKKDGEEVSAQEFKKIAPKGRHYTIESGRSVSSSDFIFPDSDKRKLKESELTGLTDEELRIARNEIFARKGFIFTSDLKDYFNSKKWYQDIKVKISSDKFNYDTMLNSYEKANYKLIQKVEEDRKKNNKK